MTQRRVIVIGGGASGLMAAGQAAGLGAGVWLLEKMASPGHKLRITGKGRCNLTNVAPMPDFLSHFGPNGRFLRPALHQFFAPELIDFFEVLGVRSADEIVDGLVEWARVCGTKMYTETSVSRLLVKRGWVTGVETAAGQVHPADAVVLATGGASYPGTGSTGDGYRMAREAGHTIVPIRPALVPLETAGGTAARLQGLSLRNVNARVLVDGKKQAEAFGEMLFTHFGISGPIVLTFSKGVVDALGAGKRVVVSIDLKPALDDPKLDARLLRDLDAYGKRQFQTILKELLPKKLIPVCIDQVGIPAEKVGHQITAEERRRLRLWLKDFRLEVAGHQPIEQAIITAGGVDVREVDPHTMASRLVKGLYFAGEVLDIDADTGGYNLQAAFSTGWVAGRAAVQGASHV
jgi:predicted Rossmann fold flavoprotein